MPGLTASLAVVTAAVLTTQPVAMQPVDAAARASVEPCVIVLPVDPQQSAQLPELIQQLIEALTALLAGGMAGDAASDAAATGGSGCPEGTSGTTGADQPASPDRGAPTPGGRDRAEPDPVPAPGGTSSGADTGGAPSAGGTGAGESNATDSGRDSGPGGAGSDGSGPGGTGSGESGSGESGSGDSGSGRSGSDESGSEDSESGRSDSGEPDSGESGSGGSGSEDSGSGESESGGSGSGESGSGESKSGGSEEEEAAASDDSSDEGSTPAAGTGRNVRAPGDLLNLENWFLTLPVGPEGDPDSIDQPELLTYSSEHFELTPEGDGVIFRAPAGGVTTENSKYPRSELREMVGEEKAAWSNASGTHVLETRQAITAVPTAKPEVVAAQIHDGGDDVLQIRLEGQTLVAQYADGAEQIVIDPAYQLGTPYDLRIVAANRGIQVFYNGEQAAEIARSGSSWYWKVGAYTQSNPERGDSPDATGEVVVYSLAVEHSGA